MNDKARRKIAYEKSKVTPGYVFPSTLRVEYEDPPSAFTTFASNPASIMSNFMAPAQHGANTRRRDGSGIIGIPPEAAAASNAYTSPGSEEFLTPVAEAQQQQQQQQQ